MTAHTKSKIAAAATNLTQEPPSLERLSNDAERREGALDCMKSLRLLLCDAAEPCGPDAADYFIKRYADAKAFVERFGLMPARVEGVLIALAEFIHINQTTGEPSVEENNSWLPWVAMTEDERAADAAWMHACYDEDEAAAKVIQFPISAWRFESCPA